MIYDEIKNNMIKNFLNKNYLWACVSNKQKVFDDMADRSPFPFTHDNECNTMVVALGNRVKLTFNFEWVKKNDGCLYHLVKIY